MIDALARFLAPLARRVDNMVARAVVRRVDDSTNAQLLQLGILDGETREGVERFQEYGFTSVPREGAEVAVVFVGGRRDHGLAIGVEDRRYRIGNLSPGEVAVYNDTGAKIVFKANGDVEVTPKAGQKLKVTADVEITGALTASGEVTGNGIALSTHTHAVAGANSGGPVVFTPVAGKTGGPT